MTTFAIVKTGGKQYVVKPNDIITIDRIDGEKATKIKLETLAIFAEDGSTIEVGKPTIAKQVEGEIVDHMKGEKIRIAHFKAKVRYRKVKGFRQALTQIKIVKV